MRISDWSSDVCSSDLASRPGGQAGGGVPARLAERWTFRGLQLLRPTRDPTLARHLCRAFADRGSKAGAGAACLPWLRSEEHTSELQSLMRISYAVFCLKKKKNYIKKHQQYTNTQ